jgi:pheromone a factor receptor
MATYTLYKRERDFRRMVMSARGLCGGRYIRLMVLSAMNIVGTIPLGTYILVDTAKDGVKPWKSWANTHIHYSTVHQYPAFIWKNDSIGARGLEMFRWLVVACAFEIFAFIGFAKEAREHYSLVYAWAAWLTGRIMRKVPAVSVPPHQPGMANSTVRAAPRVDEV